MPQSLEFSISPFLPRRHPRSLPSRNIQFIHNRRAVACVSAQTRYKTYMTIWDCRHNGSRRQERTCSMDLRWNNPNNPCTTTNTFRKMKKKRSISMCCVVQLFIRVSYTCIVLQNRLVDKCLFTGTLKTSTQWQWQYRFLNITQRFQSPIKNLYYPKITHFRMLSFVQVVYKNYQTAGSVPLHIYSRLLPITIQMHCKLSTNCNRFLFCLQSYHKFSNIDSSQVNLEPPPPNWVRFVHTTWHMCTVRTMRTSRCSHSGLENDICDMWHVPSPGLFKIGSPKCHNLVSHAVRVRRFLKKVFHRLSVMRHTLSMILHTRKFHTSDNWPSLPNRCYTAAKL